MAQPSYIQKTLRMKPEVVKVFEDLEVWHHYCRFNLLPFVPSDLYKSKEYRDFARWAGIAQPIPRHSKNKALR